MTVTGADRASWARHGWCLLTDVFPPAAVQRAQLALPALFPTAEDFAADRDPARNQPFRVDSHMVMPRFPFEDAALNELVLGDEILDLAHAFLELDDIRLYQAMASAKYAGGALEDEQLLHVDYGNHTLVVPRPEVGYQQLELFIYLSDVTPATAATRVVSREFTGDIPVERTYLSLDEYSHLYQAEKPASGPAGTVLVYRPDVYHRGVRMTEPGTARFMLHVSFKPPGTPWLGSQGLPNAAEDMSWHRFMHHATERQLTVLGFPPPGHPYWNADTLRGVAARYPTLDMTPWRAAAS
jgi:Phytanoyl-CoA dioxygenase (PhyH)